MVTITRNFELQEQEDFNLNVKPFLDKYARAIKLFFHGEFVAWKFRSF